MKNAINRRGFIGAGAMFAVAGCQSWKGGAPAITSTRSPNSLVRHLSIGCGNRAWGDVKELCTHPSVEMAAFCDVDAKYLARAKTQFPKARFYRDWREMPLRVEWRYTRSTGPRVFTLSILTTCRSAA